MGINYSNPNFISEDLNFAIRACGKAGTIIQAYSFRSNLHIREKGIADLVTEVDEKAERVILDALANERPDDLVVSEEFNSETIPPPKGRIWFVDPLDATTGYAYHAGDNLVSVMIALEEDGILTNAVVHFPLTEEWYYAIRGVGAWKNDIRLSMEGLQKSFGLRRVDMNQYGDSRYETQDFSYLRKILRSPIGARLVSSMVPHSGVSIRIAEQRKRLAVVIHDNNPAKIKQAPWDVAAPQLILEQAGGVFWNVEGERYNFREPGMIIAAASASWLNKLLDY